MTFDYRDMLRMLSDAQVEFLVVGAHAVAAHGIIRATLDFDIWVRASAANAERVWTALTRFGAPLHQVTRDDFAKPGTVFRIGVTPNCIDLMTSITGVDFDAAWAHRIEADVLGVVVPVIGREDLIRNKRAADRPKDRLDVDDLEAGRTK